ncbi:MAG: hypothetical protein Q4A24_10670 [Akkermansia sp.]|nr:hypothetical protein [Akkermansia sp.]
MPALYQFPPLCSSVDGILLRVSCIFVADGGKIGLQGEDLLEVEPLVCRVEERLESLKILPIFGLEKGQKYSLFMGQAHNVFIINTTFI